MLKKQRFDHVLLGTGLGLELTRSWVGKDVSGLIQAKDISKVILLKAITSAPEHLDASNIIKTIKISTKFEFRNELNFSDNIIWQAVLFTHDERYLYYQSDGKWVHISSENGSGFFRNNLSETSGRR